MANWKRTSPPERDQKPNLFSQTHMSRMKSKKNGKLKIIHYSVDCFFSVFSVFPKYSAFSTVNMQ